MPESLMEVTRQRLRTSDKSLAAIYADLAANGSTITYYWLRKFSSGTVRDPSVNRVEELYHYLTGQSLIEAVD